MGISYYHIHKIRTEKVIKIYNNQVTVKNKIGRKKRVHKNQIKGRQLRKKGIEPINWRG